MSYGGRVRFVNNAERIGIYGGTFDPVHRTHLAIARAARDFARLDRVLFVVAACPPHKQYDVFAGPEERFELVRAALADETGMEASRIELDRQGPSYTADTLALLQRENPGAEMFLIIGYDSLLDLPGWYNPQGVLSRARLLVAPRPGIIQPIPSQLNGCYDLLPFAETDVSSTEIRARLASGDAVGALLPGAVERLIREKGLYNAG